MTVEWKSSGEGSRGIKESKSARKGEVRTRGGKAGGGSGFHTKSHILSAVGGEFVIVYL
jgi:hypothetical protein